MSLSYDVKTGQFVTEQKSSSAGRRFLQGYELGSGPAGSLNEAYKNSPWVMRAIKFVVDPIAGLELNFATDSRGGKLPVENPAVRSFWNMPSKSLRGPMNLGDLVRATGGWIKLAGECFWILDDSWIDRRTPIERKSPICVARPQDMREICGDDGELIGWQWTRQGAKGSSSVEYLTPENVVHLACWNPYDELRGLPEWASAKLAAEGDYFASNFAKLLMENNGDRGPIVTGEGAASDEQIEQITSILRDKRERNKRGEFVPAFLVGSGLKVSEPSVQAVDAAFVSQRLENRHEIFIAFGVPPSFAQIMASYSVGSASDRFRLIEDTCKPLAAMICDAIESVMNGVKDGASVLRPGVMEREVFAAFDFDGHSTMQEVRSERMESAAKLVDRGMPWSVTSEFLDLKLPRFEGDEVGRVPFNLVEIGEGLTTENAEKPEAEKSRDVVADLRGAFEQRSLALKTSADEKAKAEKEKAEKEKVDFERAEKWRKLHLARKPWEKEFGRKVSSLIMKARRETLANIAAVMGEEKMVTKAGALELIFDLPEWLAEFLETVTQVARGARASAVRELWIDELLREDDPAELPAANTLRFLRSRRNFIKDAAESIHQGILTTLEDGLTAGETMDELSERTRQAFNSISKEKADAIAITETTVAYETARQETFESVGVEWKEWLTSGLGNVRLSHYHAGAQVVKIDETFTVGESQMMHPGDSTAPAKEVIRCNCMSIASLGPGVGE